MILILQYFIIGLVSEFSFACVTQCIIKRSYWAAFWSFVWAMAQALFVLTLAMNLDSWPKAIAWGAGIALGSTALIAGVKNNEKIIAKR